MNHWQEAKKLNETLLDCCKSNDKNTLQKIMAEKKNYFVDMNIKSSEENTPLHISVWN